MKLLVGAPNPNWAAGLGAGAAAERPRTIRIRNIGVIFILDSWTLERERNLHNLSVVMSNEN